MLSFSSFLTAAAMLMPQAPPARPAFDAASVRPSTMPFSSGVKTDAGRLTVTGAALNDLISLAYGVSGQQISGVPGGLGRYDISGTAAGTHTRAELREMLQSLLAERFKLALHPETREMPVQTLATAKNGAKLQTAAEDVDPSIALLPERSGGAVTVIGFVGANVTLPFVANYVSDKLREVVVDRTGMAGSFDFHVTVQLDRTRVMDLSIPERVIATEMITDFVKNLGLRLERQKAPVEVLVVDHAEAPGEN